MDMELPSMGIIYGHLRFSPLLENNEASQLASQEFFHQEIRDERNLVLKLSETQGRRKDNSEQSKITSPTSQPFHESRPQSKRKAIQRQV